MSRRFNAALLLAVAALLGACSEKPQGAGTARHDTPPWQGPAAGQAADAGWRAGDQAAWQEALRTRAQRGQNEYTRSTSQP
ncbi:MAG TPA: hypothetical protein PK306_22450 [Aquabacterium sp.]|nr:hypothetical protein [Aquabacterium sp.]